MLLPTPSAPPGHIVTKRRSHEDACARVHQQPAGLLQQFVVYGVNRRLAEEAAYSSQCSSACCDRSRKVRSHLTELHWLPVRRRITYDRLQPVDDRRQLVRDSMTNGKPTGWRLHIWPTTACHNTAGRRHLRSADSRCLVVPRTKTVLDALNFAVASPLCGTVCQLTLALRPLLCRLLPGD